MDAWTKKLKNMCAMQLSTEGQNIAALEPVLLFAPAERFCVMLHLQEGVVGGRMDKEAVLGAGGRGRRRDSPGGPQPVLRRQPGLRSGRRGGHRAHQCLGLRPGEDYQRAVYKTGLTCLECRCLPLKA